MTTVHVAARVVDDQVQRCSRCGTIILDYRNAMTADSDKSRLRGWREGAMVAFTESGQWLTGPDLEDNELLCEPKQ